tara:strand:- start:538 stop:822 length:285 start_codon:yes stop_codon:yes gene_type:complete
MTRCENRPEIVCRKEFRNPEAFAMKLPLLKQDNSIDVSVISNAMLSVANVRYLISQRIVDVDIEPINPHMQILIWSHNFSHACFGNNENKYQTA